MRDAFSTVRTARSLQRTIKNLFLYRAARDESKVPACPCGSCATDQVLNFHRQDGKWTVVVHQLAESLLRPEVNLQHWSSAVDVTFLLYKKASCLHSRLALVKKHYHK